jgi:hypothetical protein
MTVPLSSGFTWRVVAPHPGGVNDCCWIVDDADSTRTGHFKQVSGSKWSSMYSLGIERVAYVLASELGLAVPDTYLDDVNGNAGVATIQVEGVEWRAVDDTTIARTRFDRSDEWPLFMALDVLLGNHDRHRGNIFIEWTSSGSATDPRSGTVWFIDYGCSGLWPPEKFDHTLTAADLPNLDPETINWTAPIINRYRGDRLPPEIRMCWRAADRAQVLDSIRRISDDLIDDAVSSIPNAYFTPTEADLTRRFIVGRLARIGTLLDAVFPAY